MALSKFSVQNCSRIGAVRAADSAAGACIDHLLSKIKILRNL